MDDKATNEVDGSGTRCFDLCEYLRRHRGGVQKAAWKLDERGRRRTSVAYPYFIGVFDTVAALGHKYLGPVLVLLGVALLIGLHYLGSTLERIFPWAGWLARALSYLGAATALIVVLKNYLKISP